MTDFKLKQEDFDSSHVQRNFNSLQHAADLNEHSRTRVDDAMRAAAAHVETKEGLTQGMRRKDIGTALSFLDNHYGVHPEHKEREVVEKSFNSHFHVPDKPSLPEVANDDRYEKAA